MNYDFHNFRLEYALSVSFVSWHMQKRSKQTIVLLNISLSVARTKKYSILIISDHNFDFFSFSTRRLKCYMHNSDKALVKYENCCLPTLTNLCNTQRNNNCASSSYQKSNFINVVREKN